MNNCEKGCFVICAAPRYTIAVLEGLEAEAVQLAATIRRNFKELGV